MSNLVTLLEDTNIEKGVVVSKRRVHLWCHSLGETEKHQFG